MKFCKYCGEVVEDTTKICPKCNINLEYGRDDLRVVYNEIDLTNSVSENTPQNSKYHSLFRKLIVIVLAIASIVLFVVSITTLTSEKYRLYSDKYSEYMNEYKENYSISDNYLSYGTYGLIKDTYKDIAERYKRMADENLSKLWGLRTKSIVFGALGVGCVVSAIIVGKPKKNK